MSETTRIFELWIGEQKSGKTFALKSRIHSLEKNNKAVNSIFVLDVTGEWSQGIWAPSGLDVVWVDNWAEYLAVSRDELPRIVVFQQAQRWLVFERLIDEAQGQGCVCLLLDECYRWLPSKQDLPEPIERAILAGRHLPSLSRDLEPLHMVAACQYPRHVHHLLREQAATIIVGQMHGELAESWVRGEAGKSAWQRVEALRRWQFTVIRGERPKAPAVRWA